MEDILTYTIEIRGSADPDDLNAASPVKLTVVRAAGNRTTVSACTDQSGLIGILRHLHSQGLIFLSLRADEPPTPPAAR